MNIGEKAPEVLGINEKGDINKLSKIRKSAIVDRDEIFDIYVSLALLRPINMNSVYLWAAVNSYETKRQFDSSLKGIGLNALSSISLYSFFSFFRASESRHVTVPSGMFNCSAIRFVERLS